MKTLELKKIEFSNESVFAEPIENLVKENTLTELVDWLFDHCFLSWDVTPDFTKSELIDKLKNEWLDAGGKIHREQIEMCPKFIVNRQDN